MKKTDVTQENQRPEKKPMSKKKKIIIVICILLALMICAAGFAYVVMYDAFGIVWRVLGWHGTLPEDMVVDDSRGEIYETYENDYLYVCISRESSPYVDVQGYIDYYFNRFFDSPDWQAANDATVLDRDDSGMKRHVTLRLDGMPEGLEDTYTFVTVRTGTRYFIRALVKYDSRHNGETAQAAAEKFVDSLRISLHLHGRKLSTDFTPVLPDNWSEETKAAYEKLCSADDPYYGVFTADMEEIETKLDHKFAMSLIYFQLNETVPIEKIEKWYEEGKLTELTLQCTVTNNLDLYTASSAMLDMLKGRYDMELEAAATALREFGHPVLFRLNNEMNSDWCSYSGVVNLADPEIYVAVWRYIYDFFTERGVDNLIWIWNPNDRNFPPAKWNTYLAYFPGNEYVQMIGATGYNTGTYYAERFGETWRSFAEIYEAINGEYSMYFDNFPWIVTEFGSSSVGGDKPGWIRDMFAGMSTYDHIKAAVWFDFADFDDTKEDRPVSRPYWIAETEETLEAFRQGIKDKPERFFD